MLTSESMVSYGMITMAKTYGDSQAPGWGGIGKATRQAMRFGSHMAVDFQTSAGDETRRRHKKTEPCDDDG